MPVSITKKDGYEVRTPGGVKAKGTTKEKAESQARLLRGIEHGDWRPTGKKSAFKRFLNKKKS